RTYTEVCAVSQRRRTGHAFFSYTALLRSKTSSSHWRIGSTAYQAFGQTCGQHGCTWI
ncbi:unnamed protein product, partial [Amoebophrya sp. A25]